MSKTYVVLGGGGSFGLATSKYLLDHGAEHVIGVGRSHPKLDYFTLGVGRGDPRYEYWSYHIGYEFDLFVSKLYKELWYGIEGCTIINFAAQGEGATSYKHSWRYFDTNCTALIRLCEWLGQHWWYGGRRVGHFIHIGSSEVYGSATGAAFTEDSPLRPTSPYAVSKAAFDQYLLTLKDFPFTIIRPSNCYGPGQQLHRLIPKAVLCGLLGRKLPLHGGGYAEKSYIHTRDLASAISLVANRYEGGGQVHGVFNVGPRGPTAIRTIVGMVADILGIPFEQLCEVTEDRVHQDKRYWLDSSKIRALGWEPKIDWHEGLTEMVDWGRKYLPQLSKLPTEFVMRA